MLTEQARKIADEAKRRGLWLYEPTYKKWYSPESFKHIFTYANADDAFLERLQMKHPREGVDAGFKQLEELETRLAHFVKSVLDYYK